MHCTALHCAVPHCIVLSCAAPHCTVVRCARPPGQQAQKQDEKQKEENRNTLSIAKNCTPCCKMHSMLQKCCTVRCALHHRVAECCNGKVCISLGLPRRRTSATTAAKHRATQHTTVLWVAPPMAVRHITPSAASLHTTQCTAYPRHCAEKEQQFIVHVQNDCIACRAACKRHRAAHCSNCVVHGVNRTNTAPQQHPLQGKALTPPQRHRPSPGNSGDTPRLCT